MFIFISLLLQEVLHIQESDPHPPQKNSLSVWPKNIVLRWMSFKATRSVCILTLHPIIKQYFYQSPGCVLNGGFQPQKKKGVELYKIESLPFFISKQQTKLICFIRRNNVTN